MKYKLIIAVLVVLFLSGGVYFVGRSLGFFPTASEREAMERMNKPPQSDITFDEAIDLINSCKVKMVFQAHNRGVYLTLKDGSKRTAVKPEPNSTIYPPSPNCESVIWAIE